MAAGVIQDMDGTVETGTGHNVYNYRYAITVDGVDYYLYREYYEDDAGNSAGTGTDYAVDIMNGECYKAIQPEQIQEGEDPWSSLELQEIPSMSRDPWNPGRGIRFRRGGYRRMTHHRSTGRKQAGACAACGCRNEA